jgi:DNA-binding NarL/FixJ family response regulator
VVWSVTIQAAVVDDHDLICIAVEEILNRASDINFVGSFASVGTLLETAQEVDVLLLGDSLSQANVLAALARLSEEQPNIRVIVLGRQWTEASIRAALECGAVGVMDRDELLRDLLAVGVRRVYARQQFLSPAVGVILAYTNTPDTPVLTERELEVVRLMRDGASPKAIAVALSIQPRTVFRKQDHMREKMGVQTNEQLVLEAVKRGLI